MPKAIDEIIEMANVLLAEAPSDATEYRYFTDCDGIRHSISLDALRAISSHHPVGWFVKDFADGFIFFDDEEKARHEAEVTGALLLVAYADDKKLTRQFSRRTT